MSASPTPPMADRDPGKYVKLNVGGSLFYTTIGTLIRKNNTMFSGLFSGRLNIATDSEGWVMLDRCGKHFSTILNYLRNDTLPSLSSVSELEEIRSEASYYCIQDLCDLIDDRLEKLRQSNADLLPPNISSIMIFKDNNCQLDSHILNSTKKGVVKLTMNRYNNAFSYTANSHDNLLRNIECLEKYSTLFPDTMLFMKDVRVKTEQNEICQWSFYYGGQRVKCIDCIAIHYSSEKRLIKVEFPESKIHEDMLFLVSYIYSEQRKAQFQSGICAPPKQLHNQFAPPPHSISDVGLPRQESNGDFCVIGQGNVTNNDATSTTITERRNSIPSARTSLAAPPAVEPYYIFNQPNLGALAASSSNNNNNNSNNSSARCAYYYMPIRNFPPTQSSSASSRSFTASSRQPVAQLPLQIPQPSRVMQPEMPRMQRIQSISGQQSMDAIRPITAVVAAAAAGGGGGDGGAVMMQSESAVTSAVSEEIYSSTGDFDCYTAARDVTAEVAAAAASREEEEDERRGGEGRGDRGGEDQHQTQQLPPPLPPPLLPIVLPPTEAPPPSVDEAAVQAVRGEFEQYARFPQARSRSFHYQNRAVESASFSQQMENEEPPLYQRVTDELATRQTRGRRQPSREFHSFNFQVRPCKNNNSNNNTINCNNNNVNGDDNELENVDNHDDNDINGEGDHLRERFREQRQSFSSALIRLQPVPPPPQPPPNSVFYSANHVNLEAKRREMASSTSGTLDSYMARFPMIDGIEDESAAGNAYARYRVTAQNLNNLGRTAGESDSTANNDQLSNNNAETENDASERRHSIRSKLSKYFRHSKKNRNS